MEIWTKRCLIIRSDIIAVCSSITTSTVHIGILYDAWLFSLQSSGGITTTTTSTCNVQHYYLKAWRGRVPKFPYDQFNLQAALFLAEFRLT
jgi:hypothetical protein